MLLCDFASVKRQIGHCESAVEISGGGKIEEEEGKSWYFMGELFIWNTAAQGKRDRGITKTKGAYAELSLSPSIHGF